MALSAATVAGSAPTPGVADDGGMASDEWAKWRDQVDLDGYDERWVRMAAEGQDPHGEVAMVMQLDPTRVLDAGCGTGRVAVELARRGIEVVGVDLDPDLLDRARARAPELHWVLADLSALALDGPPFDVVVAAGNVMGFIAADDRPAAVAACARHLARGARLVSGAQLQAGWPSLAAYDGWCTASGLELEARYATWDGAPLGADPDYAVSVHRRPA